MKDDLLQEISIERENIRTVLDLVRQLKTKIGEREPDVFDQAALGTFMVNFYNAIENIFKRIIRYRRLPFPRGERWHMEILDLVGGPEKTIDLLDQETRLALRRYLGFRHVFIHGYGFNLKWEQMKPLIDGMDGAYRLFERRLDSFLQSQ